MNTYGISFIDSGETITIQAEYFDIKDGFLTLYIMDESIGSYDKFAIYAAGNILHCVKQNEYTEEEVLGQINENTTR